jgi:hypothetical protein
MYYRVAGSHSEVVLIGLAGRVRDRAEVFSRAQADCEDRRTPTERTVRPHADEKTPTAEQVAGVVAGIPAIGEACAALIKAGWRASIAGNRITVNDEVLVQFIGTGIGRAGGLEATWVIHRIAGMPPVWVVGAEREP